ncbi:hypothetical protein B0A50_06362 [Salinomyces thailandicus]|uniref:Uncharacterized protein n=1 Tax=Salinomyces thailandicus TaxID=706561 RepID=A0A4U0TRV0_9PEZI|nr:hypothetical protein B0A50_06362 [Salinomyces thailandica]
MRQYLLATVMLAAVAAQRDDGDTFNPKRAISSCDALSCQGTGICSPPSEAITAYGVGMVSEALTLSDSDVSVSYTLADGEGWGTYVDQAGYVFSSLGLYVGAPEDTDLSSQPPACSLLFQYQGQTFPEDTSDASNTTTCPQTFSGVSNECFETLQDTIRGFDYSAAGNDDNYPSRTRCEALAQYVEYNVQHIDNDPSAVNTVCSFFGSLVSVTGGAISGPEVTTDVARPAGNDSSCQPVLPQDTDLHRVAYAREVLQKDSSGPGPSSFGFGVGGRVGYTPVVSVLYDDEDDVEPEVTFLCMRTYTPDGEILPFSRLSSSGAGPQAVVSGALVTLALGGCLFLVLSL